MSATQPSPYRLTRRVVRLLARRTVPLLSCVRNGLGGHFLAADAWNGARFAGRAHDITRLAGLVDVRFVPGLDPEHAGTFNSSSSPPEIGLNGLRGDVGLTLLHELGHYIDVTVLGDGEYGASLTDARFSSWGGAVSNTKT